jgi:hypothetical protein
MTPHTALPWHCGTFREIGTHPGCDIGAANGANIAWVIHDDDKTPAETRENGRLIAAAPALLAACLIAASVMRLSADESDVLALKKIRAAIRLATEGTDA